MPESLSVRLSRSSNVVVVDVVGELDAGTSARVVDAIDAAALFDGEVVVVDTTALTFVDSGGRRALDHACRRANAVFVPGRAVERFDRLLARALHAPGHVGAIAS
jgi:anti-anti-sigma factor